MTEADLKRLFPKSSQSFLNQNLTLPSDKSAVRDRVGLPQRLMNKTETEFAMILETQKRNGEIASYEYEGITLRFANVKYTPDFTVFPLSLAVSGQIKLVEVKGNYIKGKFERAVERFRHARTYYGDRFLFELWQKTRAEGWRRLL